MCNEQGYDNYIWVVWTSMTTILNASERFDAIIVFFLELLYIYFLILLSGHTGGITEYYDMIRKRRMKQGAYARTEFCVVIHNILSTQLCVEIA